MCDLDDRAVRTARILAADGVELAGSGHPGTPISLAAAAYLLFQRHLKFDPQDTKWLGRDRFVLSAGHASMLQYAQLFLAGTGLELDDIKQFRRFGSVTPGHPEWGLTKGIEVTTGPLGSGLAAGVGMAMSARRVRAMLDPKADPKWGKSPFDHRVYVIAGDGCLQEGISSEACSLAGTQKLGNLILIYDDNHISIEDDTKVAFNEDVLQRFAAYGWHTQRVDWLKADGTYQEDLPSLDQALEQAKAETERPSIIALRTIIGWPSPGLQNTGTIHGAKLGAQHLAELHQALGLKGEEMFQVDWEAIDQARENAKQRGAAYRRKWEQRFQDWQAANPNHYQLLQRLEDKKLPADWQDALPVFKAGKAVATRSASGEVISALGKVLPEFWGGSADLAGSNKTVIKGAGSFLPPEYASESWPGDYSGRIIHFGVREHAMGGIMNGIALDGLTRVFGGTFFVFADYMRGAVRLAALMNLPVTYVWTHDSIGVGEDGPTHQPVEHLASYRAIPNLALVRPMDANETTAAWKAIIAQSGPCALILSRQNLPTVAREGLNNWDGDNPEDQIYASASLLSRGAYILADTPQEPDVILMGSGSEVQYALAGRKLLQAQGIQARVVSMPCMEWFDQQPAAYRNQVLPEKVQARVSIEAGLTSPWLPYIGKGVSLGINSFGTPGSQSELYDYYQLTAKHVAQAAQQAIENARN